MRKQLAAWVVSIFFIAAASASGQTFQVIHNFSNPETMYSFGRMALSSNTLYGVGGGYIGGLPHFGSVFRVKTDGSGYGIVKQFPRTYPSTGGIYTNTEGSTPLGGLVSAGD